VDFVPPLHQRAAGGTLLWIRTLDVHLWQKAVLITDEILDDGYWDVKGMLGDCTCSVGPHERSLPRRNEPSRTDS